MMTGVLTLVLTFSLVAGIALIFAFIQSRRQR